MSVFRDLEIRLAIAELFLCCGAPVEALTEVEPRAGERWNRRQSLAVDHCLDELDRREVPRWR
jgi:hypothetical protein